MSPTDKIRIFIASCRRRFLGLEALSGLFFLLSAAAGAFLAAATGALVIDSTDPGLARPGLRLVWGACILLVLWRYLARPFLRMGSPVSVAKEIERRIFTRRSLDLVGALQLSHFSHEQVERAGVSRELIDAYLEQQAKQTAEIRADKVFGGGRLKRPLFFLAGLLAACALTAIAIPDQAKAGVHLLLGKNAHTAASAAAGDVSWVGDLRLTYNYPAYSERQERVVEGTDGAIVALPGTRVAIAARTDRPIARASLRLTDSVLPLKIEDGRHLSGELVVTRAGRYHFDLADMQGHEWPDPRGRPIDTEPDRPPAVVLNRPAHDLEIRDRDKLSLLYGASDDYGLGEIRLVWRVAGRPGSEQRRELRRLSAGTRKTSRRSYLWDLAELRLEPGDRLQFYIEATDNDTVSGPKVGRSATCNVKIFSADEHHRDLLQQVQNAWEGLLSNLADVLDLEPQAGRAKVADASDYMRLFKGGGVLLQKMRGLSSALRADRLAPASLVAAFAHVTERLSSLQAGLGRLLNGYPARAETTRRLLGANRALRISRLERDILYLEDLLDLVRLQEIDRLGGEMEDARKRLSELMKHYAAAPDDQTRRQIEEQIARLKDKIAQLLARQREVLKGVRDEYLNPDALRKMLGDRDMLSALDRVQKLLNQGKIDQAAAELQKLQGMLSSLRAAVERSRSRLGGSRYQQLAQQMSKAMGELNMITERQRKLMDATGRIRDRLFEKLKKKGLAALKKNFAELRKRTAEIRRKIDALPQEWPDQYIEQLRLRALQQARLLEVSLKSIDIPGSLNSAEKLADAAERLANEVRIDTKMRSFMNRGRKEQQTGNQKTADAAAKASQAVYRELQKIVPRPEKLIGSRDARELGRLGRRQDELRARLRDLEQALRKINQAAPIFGKLGLSRLERGGGHMLRASDALGRKQPGRAHSQQRGAVAELEALQKDLKKSCRGGKGGFPLPMGGSGLGQGMDMGGPGGRPAERDVDLPDPDEYKAPAAFREALLKGMKDPVPEAFKQQVRRYYEELVK